MLPQEGEVSRKFKHKQTNKKETNKQPERSTSSDIKVRGEVREGGATVCHGEDHISTDVYTADHGGSHTKVGGYFLKELWIKGKTPVWGGKKY